uniref:Reverse transcriptase Ty1/copia-type domain-containing protein n=1 Tax=Chromera velia CCMP2878 TaxID=1169474 RepID=A0A0G4GMD3_9ALVE|eukprot:Cvel_22519.t1-p1 / transcript=Cvel_22519.t1 / gene=Cvel_22519 / organism=Chromera_velia_CCMP2878 / gene_product=Copia protein, putative / transcript_product=Copia protein, putative / location=Cvel_scaffold2221:5094-9460(-) / protein_length=864 / sequence_SO=supercontig / SO=protein_coding / is_pseudo=false
MQRSKRDRGRVGAEKELSEASRDGVGDLVDSEIRGTDRMVSAPPNSLPLNSSSSHGDQRGAGGARTRATSRRTVRANVRGSPESSLALGFPLPPAKIPTEASSSSLPRPPLRDRKGDDHTRGCGARGGGIKWVVKKPVVDSGCSRHFFNRDIEACVVEVRETDSEFVGVEGDVARAESDVTVDLPGVECVDRAALADDVDRFSDFDVDEDREVDVLAAGGADPEAVVSSSKSQAIFPDSVPSAAVRQLDCVVEESVSSVYAPVPFPPPFAAGSQLQAGHLELRSQQQGVGGGEEKEKQSGQGREPVQAAQPAEKKGEGEVVLPDIPDDDSLFGLNLLGESGGAAAFASFLAREGEQQGSRETEGVQEAQDDKKVQGAQEGKRVQRAQNDSKEGERKKVRREGNGFKKAPQRLMVDKKVVDQMMKHVNPRKGHIDAKEEEVEKGLFDEAIQGELKSFEENKLPGRVPTGSPERFAPGVISQLERAMYGLKDAPRLYGKHFKQIAAEEGWEEIVESIFVLKDEEKKVKAVMAVHVDDLLIFSADSARDFEPLRQRLKMDKPEILSAGGEMGYTGLEVRKNESGFEISQEAYLKSIPVQTNDLPRKSLSPEMLNEEREEEKEEDLVAVMMKVMGVLGWVCRTSADLPFVFSELSCYSSRPTGSKLVAALLALIRAREKNDSLRFEGMIDPKLVLFVDAAYSLSRCEGRGGFEAYLVDKKEKIEGMRRTNLVAWKSKRIKRKLISLTSAELCALVDGVKQSFQWKRLAEALWMKPLEVEIYIDSAPLMKQLESGYSKREPRMDGLLKYMQQELRALKARVLWVSTDRQRADRHTKYKLEKERGSQAPQVEAKKEGHVKRGMVDFAKTC